MYFLATTRLIRKFSIAEVERINKVLKNIITEKRNSLKNLTTESLLLLYKKRFTNFDVKENFKDIDTNYN